MADDLAVEVRNVRKSYESVVAVDNVSLAIRHGEFFSLLGPSGCGKTTTLRMIAGLEFPNAGEIVIQGRVMGDTPPFKRDVNTVFQSYALFPHMSVAQNVAFGLEMKRVPRAETAHQVQEALRLVRLEGYGERRPKQLSGGQRQRVALARAIINRPAVLLLDEPLGALDLKLRKEMQLELKHLQTTLGLTFIYVTHDQEEALTMSDRIAVMHNGRVLQIGAAEDIYERPASRFVADFIGETNFLAGRVTTVSGTEARVLLATGHEVGARAGAGAVPGAEVTLAIRPEQLHLHCADQPSAHDGASRIAGRIEEVIYSGSDRHYHVRLPTQQHLRVRTPNAGSSAGGHRDPLAPGVEVGISWLPEHALVLSD